MKPICPDCDTAIEDGDFNVSTDIAYCRRCKKDLSLSSIIAIASVDPITYEKFERKHCRNSGYQKRAVIGFPRDLLLFLVPFAIVWIGFTFGASIIVPLYEHGFNAVEIIGPMLAGFPFLVGAIVLLASIYLVAFGKLRINIDDYSLSISTGAYPFCINKEVQLDQITAIKLVLCQV